MQAAPPAILADLARFAALQAPAADELLMIGRRHVRSNNSWMHNYHRLVKGKPRHQLLMHPDDLASRGLSDGQRVRVSSRVGQIEVEVLGQSRHDARRGQPAARLGACAAGRADGDRQRPAGFERQ